MLDGFLRGDDTLRVCGVRLIGVLRLAAIFFLFNYVWNNECICQYEKEFSLPNISSAFPVF